MLTLGEWFLSPSTCHTSGTDTRRYLWACENVVSIGSPPNLNIFVPSFATSRKHLFPKSHILLALPKTIAGLEENGIYSGKGVESGATARKTAVTMILDSSADIAGGEVNSCDWRSHRQADTRKKVNPQENDVRHYLIVTNNNLPKYLQ